MSGLFDLARPVLHCLDPETAHSVTIRALSLLPAKAQKPDDIRLQINLFGKTFPNSLGLAAGFDKQCEVPDALLNLGFGFVETGGVTPLPQAGNPRPRVFRLPHDEAIINRYGLNSEGLDAIGQRLKQRQHKGGVVGVNMGANKNSIDRVQDYVTCIEKLAGFASFLTLNISSPNTPGLRDLQGEAYLDDLLARTIEVRDTTDYARGSHTPLWLKIAPDLDESGLDLIVKLAQKRGIDALVISNTTTARTGLSDVRQSREEGGLSGKPLFKRSTQLLAQAYLRVGRSLPLVGVGGIDSSQTAWTKICAGASLLQLYTALVYQGPGLVERIKKGLVQKLEDNNLSHLNAVVGQDAAELAINKS